MSSLTTRRSLTYWVFFILFLIGGGPILRSEWMGGELTHNLLDGTAAFLAIAAALLVIAYGPQLVDQILNMNLNAPGTEFTPW